MRPWCNFQIQKPPDMDAIKPALDALICAYKVYFAGAPGMPNDDVLIDYMLCQIQNAPAAKQLGQTLDEKSVAGFIKPSALIALVQCALEVKQLRRRLADSKKEADIAWNLIGSAGRIIRGKKGTAHVRYSAALYELGLIGEKHGQDRSDPKYQEAAERYYFLRTGGYEFHKGELINFDPCGHDDSVATVMDEFNVEDWGSLERAWRRIDRREALAGSKRDKIQPSYDAEVFPVK